MHQQREIHPNQFALSLSKGGGSFFQNNRGEYDLMDLTTGCHRLIIHRLSLFRHQHAPAVSPMLLWCQDVQIIASHAKLLWLNLVAESFACRRTFPACLNCLLLKTDGSPLYSAALLLHFFSYYAADVITTHEMVLVYCVVTSRFMASMSS